MRTRILITGDRFWKCRLLAQSILRRLIARYGPEIVIVRGGGCGVEEAFNRACQELGIASECHCVTDDLIRRYRQNEYTVRHQTMVEAGAKLCIALHRDITASQRTKDCVRRAIEAGIPTYLVDSQEGRPRALHKGDPRLETSTDVTGLPLACPQGIIEGMADQPIPNADSQPQAARLAPKLRALADQGIFFGTSSWKYEGWLGTIYTQNRYETRGKLSKKKFEDTCLTEYAETFPTVCGDFAFYQFPTEQYWAKLFDATPANFVFGLKVPEDITVAVWPKHARYGRRAGQDNEHFLSADPFARFFADRLAKYQDRVGPLIFEFGTFNKSTFPTPGDFLERLDPFLAALPMGFHYAVEIRNREYLSPAYFERLAKHNVAHVFSAWTRMPGLDEQAQLPDAYTADFTVVRALLGKGRSYEQAVKSFEPYRLIQETNEGAREGMREIAERSRKKKAPAFLFVNNRLEGNAPSTIEAVAECLTV